MTRQSVAPGAARDGGAADERGRAKGRVPTRNVTIRARDGTSLFYEVIGEGPPLVLLDGLACSGFIWRRLVPFFQDRMTIIHAHYRGHGRSGMPRTPQTRIMHLVEDMVLILEREKVAGAPAIGHSMGVEVALELGHMRGDLVSGLVLACGGYERLLSTFQDTDLAVYLMPFFKFFEKNYPGAVRFAWQNFPLSFSYKIALRFRQVNPILVRKQDLFFYLRHLRKVDPAVFISLLEEIQHHDTGRFFEDLRAPVLVVAGEHDTFTPPDLARAMAEQIAGAELLVMRGATHIAPLELPELFNLAVERFLIARHWL